MAVQAKMGEFEVATKVRGYCRVSRPSFFFPHNLSSAISLNQLLTISQLGDLVSRTHRNVIVNDVIIRLCMHFKFGDLIAHRQTKCIANISTLTLLIYDARLECDTEIECENLTANFDCENKKVSHGIVTFHCKEIHCEIPFSLFCLQL